MTARPSAPGVTGGTDGEHRNRARRLLFVNEDIGGHRAMHMHIRAALESEPGVTATFVDVPPPGVLRRVAAAPVPGLAQRDLDLQPLRYQLAQSAWVRPRLARWASHYDVVHVYTQNIALLSAKTLRRRPSVISIDATGTSNAYRLPYRYPTEHTAARVRLMRRFEEPTLEAATLLVAQSGWAATSLREEYGVAPERIRVIPFGISIPPEPARREPDGLPEVTFTGSSLGRKGGMLLLRAYDRYLRGRVVLNLVTRDRIESRPGVNVYSDLVPGDTRLGEILSRTAVFAFPSTVDTFGYAVLEAMAASVPVVAAPTSAVPEIVVDGETGLLLPPDPRAFADAILGLVADEPLRRRMGEAGRRRVIEHFDAKDTTEALLGVLDEAVALFAQRNGPPR